VLGSIRVAMPGIAVAAGQIDSAPFPARTSTPALKATSRGAPCVLLRFLQVGYTFVHAQVIILSLTESPKPNYRKRFRGN
jgi:hypothetical protein